MKIQENKKGGGGEGGAAPSAPPLNPPMANISCSSTTLQGTGQTSTTPMTVYGWIPDDARNANRYATRDNTRCCFEKALFYSQQDHLLRVRIKRDRYSHIKLATIPLDCCSTAARIQEKTIPPCDIKQAEEHLNIVHFKLGDGLPISIWIQLLKTRSDQFYCQGSYNLAKVTAEEAFELASFHKFDTELNSLRGMMELFEIRKLHQSHPSFHR